MMKEARSKGRVSIWLSRLMFMSLVFLTVTLFQYGTAVGACPTEPIIITKTLDAFYGTASGNGITIDGLELTSTITGTLAGQIFNTYPDSRVTNNLGPFVDNSISEIDWLFTPPENFPAEQNLRDDLSNVPPGFTVSFSPPVFVTTETYNIVNFQTSEDVNGSICVIDHIGNAVVNYFELNGTILVNVNDLVTFVPIQSTFKTVTNTSGCPAGFTRKFSFKSRLTNISNDSELYDLSAKVKTLTNNNLLQNADGGPGGVGAVLTVPEMGGFSDGELGPGEFVDVPFVICLKNRNRFTFTVDVLGVVGD